MGERIQNSVQLTFTRLMLDWLQLRIPTWHFDNESISSRLVFDPIPNCRIKAQEPRVGYGVIVDEHQKFILFNHPPQPEDEDKICNDLRKVYATSPKFFEEVQASIDIIEMRVRAECTCSIRIPGVRPHWGE